MTRKQDEILVDWYINDMGDEINISIRTESGRPLSGNDIIDGATFLALEGFGEETKPITAEDIKNDIKLH